MYTIKQAALRSGLPITTVRAWERRYGVVAPERTAGGYRLYDDKAIERLAAMRRLVEIDGLRPSQAADQVRAGRVATPGPAGVGPGEVPDIGDGRRQGGTSTERMVEELRHATRRLDVAAIERILDEAFASERFEAATANVIYPTLRAIGEDWASGAIDVAMEHAASETIRRRLARFYDAAVDRSSSFDVIVGLPPGSRHEIGAMGFAVAARRRGLGVLYLGADVPVASWVRTADAVGPAVAIVGAAGDADVPAALDVVTALRASSSRPVVAAGGRAAGRLAAVADVVALPEPMDAAVEAVHGLVRARA